MQPRAAAGPWRAETPPRSQQSIGAPRSDLADAPPAPYRAQLDRCGRLRLAPPRETRPRAAASGAPGLAAAPLPRPRTASAPAPGYALNAHYLELARPCKASRY